MVDMKNERLQEIATRYSECIKVLLDLDRFDHGNVKNVRKIVVSFFDLSKFLFDLAKLIDIIKIKYMDYMQRNIYIYASFFR